jgi:CRP-like cAMP-binding protein
MRSIVRKERLKRDADVQALEDCACLVFLENEFAAFADKHDDDKIVDIVAKTWAKMSEAGHSAAVGLLPLLDERLRGLVLKAVTPSA